MTDMMNQVRFDEKGLVPAIIQDDATGEVLTLCYMNRDALAKSLEEGVIYVFRRSKGKLMKKGETSGCIQKVKRFFIDCEGNSLLFKVEQVRAACHEGYFTCYFRQLDKEGKATVSHKRVFEPKDVYKKA